MAHRLTGRLQRLENRNMQPIRNAFSVVRITPSGDFIGDPPEVPCMIVKDFGAEREWEAGCIAQQQNLVKCISDLRNL